MQECLPTHERIAIMSTGTGSVACCLPEITDAVHYVTKKYRSGNGSQKANLDALQTQCQGSVCVRDAPTKIKLISLLH